MRSEKTDLKPLRHLTADLRPKRSKGPDLRLEGPDLRPDKPK